MHHPPGHRLGSVGDQGVRRDLAGRHPPRHDGPRDREAGGGGARTPFPGDHGGGGVPGGPEDEGCRGLVWHRPCGDDLGPHQEGSRHVIWRVSSSCRAALALLILALLASSAIPSARAQGPRVLLAGIDGPIDRSTVDYIREAIDEARVPELGYSALMIRLDTPGGGLAETTELAQLMNNAADVPILGWVGPVGAQAWSAGIILLARTNF